MSTLDKIAFFQNRRDEVPNQELARQLAASEDRQGISEVAENLWNKNQNIRSDCLKVLYEIGYLKPDLIASYAGDFIRLLKDKNNRMVWGAMIALATVADRASAQIGDHLEDVIQATERGSLISVVWGIKTLAIVAATNPQYFQRVYPLLMNQLRTCIPRDLPTHAENVLCAVNDSARAEYLSILETRLPGLKPAQAARIRKIIKQLNKT